MTEERQMSDEHARAREVLAAYNGGLVKVADPDNPRGFTTYYRPLEAMTAALAFANQPAVDADRERAIQAAFTAIHGKDADPHQSPETWAFASEVADAVLAALSPAAPVQVLREALEPFAKAADVRLCADEGYWTDAKSIQGTDVAFYVTFGDLRRAREALSTLPDAEGGSVGNEKEDDGGK